jgi:hypothetical protein
MRNLCVFIELAATNWFQRRQRLGSLSQSSSSCSGSALNSSVDPEVDREIERAIAAFDVALEKVRRLKTTAEITILPPMRTSSRVE